MGKHLDGYWLSVVDPKVHFSVGSAADEVLDLDFVSWNPLRRDDFVVPEPASAFHGGVVGPSAARIRTVLGIFPFVSTTDERAEDAYGDYDGGDSNPYYGSSVATVATASSRDGGST